MKNSKHMTCQRVLTVLSVIASVTLVACGGAVGQTLQTDLRSVTR